MDRVGDTQGKNPYLLPIEQHREAYWSGEAYSFQTETRTVYQFHGCYWHGHDCALNRGKEFNEKRKKPMAELLEET